MAHQPYMLQKSVAGRPPVETALFDMEYYSVGGFVQIPCIERNATGAIKAYNAVLLATSEEECQHMVSLDATIMAMGEIGRDMNAKFKETSEGGLAVSMVEC